MWDITRYGKYKHRRKGKQSIVDMYKRKNNLIPKLLWQFKSNKVTKLNGMTDINIWKEINEMFDVDI
jgi:hypothetical protein